MLDNKINLLHTELAMMTSTIKGNFPASFGRRVSYSPRPLRDSSESGRGAIYLIGGIL